MNKPFEATRGVPEVISGSCSFTITAFDLSSEREPNAHSSTYRSFIIFKERLLKSFRVNLLAGGLMEKYFKTHW